MRQRIIEPSVGVPVNAITGTPTMYRFPRDITVDGIAYVLKETTESSVQYVSAQQDQGSGQYLNCGAEFCEEVGIVFFKPRRRETIPAAHPESLAAAEFEHVAWRIDSRWHDLQQYLQTLGAS